MDALRGGLGVTLFGFDAVVDGASGEGYCLGRRGDWVVTTQSATISSPFFLSETPPPPYLRPPPRRRRQLLSVHDGHSGQRFDGLGARRGAHAAGGVTANKRETDRSGYFRAPSRFCMHTDREKTHRASMPRFARAQAKNQNRNRPLTPPPRPPAPTRPRQPPSTMPAGGSTAPSSRTWPSPPGRARPPSRAA